MGTVTADDRARRPPPPRPAVLRAVPGATRCGCGAGAVGASGVAGVVGVVAVPDSAAAAAAAGVVAVPPPPPVAATAVAPPATSASAAIAAVTVLPVVIPIGSPVVDIRRHRWKGPRIGGGGEPARRSL